MRIQQSDLQVQYLQITLRLEKYLLEQGRLLNNIEELDLLLKAEYKVHRKFTTFIH